METKNKWQFLLDVYRFNQLAVRKIYKSIATAKREAKRYTGPNMRVVISEGRIQFGCFLVEREVEHGASN